MAHLRLLRHHSLHCDHNLSLLRLISPFSSSSTPINPIAYPAKPKDPSEEETTQKQEQSQEKSPSSYDRLGTDETLRLLESLKTTSTWTPEEARFTKDAPAITPVSYAAKVAPLPEQSPSSSDPLGTAETLSLLESLKTTSTLTPEEARFAKDAPAITPVSYAAKVAPLPEQFPSSSDPLGTAETLSLLESLKTKPTWTREEARFVKDGPVITPVSYAAKVAPLPEDREGERQEEIEEKERQEAQEQLNREARRIESDVRVRRHIFGLQEEEKIPYPTLIRAEKKPQKVAVDLMEAIRQVKANAKRNFVETVEAHVNLGVDPRRGDQMVRGAITLPHGTGKTVRVAVFAEGAAAEEARAAGADVVGGDELIEQIRTGGGKLNFDKCIATPMYMPRLSKIARILGPRGLMPNPKLGSVTSDVSTAVKAAKCGRIDFKIDKTAIVHVGLGKVNFSEDVLRENIGAFVNALLLAKPAGLKKTSKYAGYVKNFTLSCTMGPGFPVTIQSLSAAADHYSKLQVK